MKINTREDGPVTVVSVEGDLVLGEPETTFKRVLTDLIDEGQVNLIVDLGKVHLLDSSGLGALVQALTAAQKEGGQTKLLHVGPRIRKLLEITKLESVFEVFEDEELAVASF
jgi:anti-sigma B factor antagonist